MTKDIIVVGASAGGLDALKRLVDGLAADLEASVFIVLHLEPSARSELARILQKNCALPVCQAEDGDPIRAGRIFVARPDYHLVLDDQVVRLTRGPRENRFRPAIDVLFRSAAYIYGGRVIGAVLSGALDDGSAGLWSIKNRGGTSVVQDPEEAEFSSMPENALAQVETDYVISVNKMAELFGRLTGEKAAAPPPGPLPPDLEVEMRIAKEGNGLAAGVMDLGAITPYTCPECHGALVQLKRAGVPRFRCHTGHAYSINTLLAEVTEYVEDSLWNSMRAIEESALLLEQLARHVRNDRKNPGAASVLDEKAAETLKRASVLRAIVHEHQTVSQDNAAEVKDGGR